MDYCQAGVEVGCGVVGRWTIAWLLFRWVVGCGCGGLVGGIYQWWCGGMVCGDVVVGWL